MHTKITKTCAYCGANFAKVPSRAARARYCSRACMNRAARLRPPEIASHPDLPGVSVIPLPDGRAALIDTADVPLIKHIRWKASLEGRDLWYVVGSDFSTGRRRMVRLHIMLMNPPDGFVVDHVNHDGLDNRRTNLRIATSAQNAQNRRVSTIRRSSAFKGVCWIERYEKWQAGIQVGGKSIHLGWFDTELDAALAYDAAAIRFFGEYAHTNFPP